MQLKLAFQVLLFIGAVSCNSNKSVQPTEEKQQPAEEAKPLTKLVFDKLLGTWQSEDGKSFERWTKINEKLYESAVYSLKNKDTLWNERAKIYPENDQWVFENLVKGQNDGKSVKFTSTLLNESTVHFTNPTHDFPTDIHYYLPDSNTINAFIVGPNQKGGKDTIPYNSKRFQ